MLKPAYSVVKGVDDWLANDDPSDTFHRTGRKPEPGAHRNPVPRKAVPKKVAAPRKRAAPKRRAPRDGDGDGFVDDNKPTKRPAPKVPKAPKLPSPAAVLKKIDGLLKDRADNAFGNMPMPSDPAAKRALADIHKALPLATISQRASRLDPKILRGLADASLKMRDEYPMVADHIEVIDIEPYHPGRLAALDFGMAKSALLINLYMETTARRGSTNPSPSDFNVAQSYADTFFHEFGHAIQARERSREILNKHPDINSRRGQWGNLVKKPASFSNNMVLSKVSPYAATDELELGAELWSLHMSGRTDQIPKELMPIIRSMEKAARQRIVVKPYTTKAAVPTLPGATGIDQIRSISYDEPKKGDTLIEVNGKPDVVYDPKGFARLDILEKRRGSSDNVPSPFSTPKEIVGHHGHHPHGKSIRWPAMYEHLREKGMSKAKAAAISNAAWKKKRLGIPTNTPTSVRGVVKSGFEEIGGQIVSKNDDKRTVFGWAYVTHDQLGELNVDGSGEFVDDPDELEKAAYSFVLKARTGDADHTNVVKSTMIESMVFTPDKIEALGLQKGDLPVGWWTGWKIHDDDVWAGVKKKKYTSFSIFGRSCKKEVEDA